MKIPQDAFLETGKASTASLRLYSGSLIRMAPHTKLQLKQLKHGKIAGKRRESFKLIIGSIWAKAMKLTGNESSFEIATQHAVAGIRGTAFEVTTSLEGDSYSVSEGSIEITRKDIQSRPIQLSAGDQLQFLKQAATSRRGISLASSRQLKSKYGNAANIQDTLQTESKSEVWAKKRRLEKLKKMRKKTTSPSTNDDSNLDSNIRSRIEDNIAKLKVNLILPSD